MKRLLLVAIVLAAFVPAASRAGACSPLDCSPSQFALARGSMLAVRIGVDKPLRVIDLRTGATRWRLPAGIVSGNVLVHQDGSLLTWYSLTTGARLRDAVAQQRGAFELVGLAQNGQQAVLARTQHRSTTFALVSPTAQRIVKLGGNRWSFDALNRDNLFLIRYLHTGYEIRLFHVGSGVLDKVPLQDPKGSSTIWGSPWSRLSSANGRYIDAYRFRVNSWNTATATAVMSPDGERIAFTDANHIWFLVLAKRTIVAGPAHVAIAMAYSPDQKHLWVLGQRSRISSLRPR
jgi:hypothetical protein